MVFAAGETTKTISVPVLEDLIYEGTETFNVNLSNPSNATISDGQGIGTILDNDTGSEIDVDIDIKPGVVDNPINCQDNKHNGVIPVAILTTDDFDATTVDHTTVTFGVGGATETHIKKKSGEVKRHEEDVDLDGDIDLVFHFRFGETGLVCDDVEACLTGETYDGTQIIGCDAITTVPSIVEEITKSGTQYIINSLRQHMLL
jgi:hypothetical protein